ncbi:hypothetical protein E4Z66_14965 [Aliishimia ponticola]|uniref:Transposase IS4-like domain-containing protein n=1 Tax=Aliishimia ponticola TaxID=2499833 RepID=A0A4S4N7I9_9RHOB|nr:transposase [Aliishimia ponticola]THH35122.1 hypothetical protein E4Z66_14965 [Aliishimia ponticola]
MRSWAHMKYKTTNWSTYSDSVKRRGSLSLWFDPQMVWISPPTGRRGRRQQFSEAAMLPELFAQIQPDQNIGNVTADGAYDTRKCHDAIAAPDTHAVIPPRKNAKPWKPTSNWAIARNQAVEASRYLGRTLWRRWSGYHRRSRVETKMHCVKRLGESLLARDFGRRVAGIQVRITVLNRYTALGIPVTEPVG